jgi:hypothetical protein
MTFFTELVSNRTQRTSWVTDKGPGDVKPGHFG